MAFNNQLRDNPFRIALWGPKWSGKSNLINAFKRATVLESLKNTEFSYDLTNEIGVPQFPDIPTKITPTSVMKDSEYFFKRKIKNESRKTEPQILSTSGFHHHIIVTDSQGQKVIEKQSREHTNVLQSDGIILTIDLAVAVSDNLPEDSWSKITYAQEVVKLLAELQKPKPIKDDNNSGDRFVAVCLTKADVYPNRRQNWQVILGTEFDPMLIDAIGPLAEGVQTETGKMYGRVFITSSWGYEKDWKTGSQVEWQPENVAHPFFWLFQKVELTELEKSKSFMGRFFQKGKYIPYIKDF